MKGSGDVGADGDEIAGREVGQEAVVKCTTSAGLIVMRLHRSWSPHGYDRAARLFERGYYDHSHFFRVVPHFLVQFGISYTNDVELKRFADKSIQDDPKREDLMPFREGYISFAGSGPNSRTSQLFIAYDRAGGLGSSPWETPFGEVVEGMENVRNLYSVYGDMPPWGKGPQQGPIRNRGPSYIEESFPLLDKFETCTVERIEPSPDVSAEAKDDGSGIGEVVEKARPAIRGGHEKARVAREKIAAIISKRNISAAADKPYQLLGKIGVVVVILLVISHLLARRKRKKQNCEKSV